jgi:hypothetical protein
MAKTVWFPAKKYKPVRVGWYEYKSVNFYLGDKRTTIDRFWWDGKRWLDHPDDPKIYGWSVSSCRPDEAWRGRMK